jgi:hypothetical protein
MFSGKVPPLGGGRVLETVARWGGRAVLSLRVVATFLH